MEMNAAAKIGVMIPAASRTPAAMTTMAASVNRMERPLPVAAAVGAGIGSWNGREFLGLRIVCWGALVARGSLGSRASLVTPASPASQVSWVLLVSRVSSAMQA